MIPLKLERREQEIVYEDPKTGKKTKSKHYILHVNMEIELARLQHLAQVDPEKIALALPRVDKAQEEVYFQDTPESAIHGEALVEETEVADVPLTYADILLQLATLLDAADPMHLARYMIEQYGTEGRRLLAAKAALEDDGPARKEIQEGLKDFIDEFIDAAAQEDAQQNGKELESQGLITSDQRATIKLMAEQVYGSLESKNFLDFRYTLLKNSKALRDLSESEGNELIQALNVKMDEQIEQPKLC